MKLHRSSLLASLFAFVVTSWAIAQQTIPVLPKLLQEVPSKAEPKTEPKIDPQVKPAQQLGAPILPGTNREILTEVPKPAGVETGITATPAPVAMQVPHPPTPVVRIQVFAPANLAPSKPIPYRVVVSNASAAAAHRVIVRMPIPEGITSISKCEPLPDAVGGQVLKLPAALAGVKEFTWNFKTLSRGESKTIDLEFQTQATLREISARAYVAFEHGEQVSTNIEKPKLDVKKAIGEQVAQGEPVTVRVEVKNASAVSIPKVRLVETVSAGLEFQNDSQAERGEKANQRIWQLGTLAPGQSKIVTYQVLGKQGGELTTASNAASNDASVVSETVEAKTRVLVPGLQLGFTGPTEAVPARKSATYEATVRNSGTLPLRDVRVSIPIPTDCKLRSKTNAGQTSRDAVTWNIPQLRAGEAESFRIVVDANSSGKRTMRATARDGRGLAEEAKDLSTVFQGRADIHWKPDVSPIILPVGKTGTVTVAVRNDGGETAKAVTIRMVLPVEVRAATNASHPFTQAGDEIIFKPVTILPGKSTTFTLSFEAKKAGRAYFTLRLQEPDTLGEKDLVSQSAIEIQSTR